MFDIKLIEDGIPEKAYQPKTGDDPKVARDLKARNRDERKGQRTLGLAPPQIEAVRIELAKAGHALGAHGEDDLGAVAHKEEVFQRLHASDGWRRLKDACDLWTAAFFAKLEKPAPGQPERIPTTDTVKKALARQTPQALKTLLFDLEDQRFFHWPLEFPEVFDPAHPAAERGFDVVLGNPPWERIKLQEQEFFAERHEGIALAPNKAARACMIKALATFDNPAERQLYDDFRRALHAADAASMFVRGSGRFPLTARGDVNTYSLFAESFLCLINARGRAGVIVPLGIATDDSTKRFFGELISTTSLASLLAFENEEFIFRGLHHAYRFALLTLRGDGRGTQPEFAFFCRRPEHLADRRRRFTLSPEDIALINPNTRTCPIFRTGHDAELTKKIYRRVPVLIDESRGEAGNPWGIRFMAMFHMANDSGLFRTYGQLREAGGELTDTTWTLPNGERWLPLYEAKMIHHFDHRWASYGQGGREAGDLSEAEKADPSFRALPRYWVEDRQVEARLANKGWTCGWLIGWRRNARSTDERSMLLACFPQAAVGDSIFLLLSRSDAHLQAALIANLCSLPLDFVFRQKLGGVNTSFYYITQIAVLPPSAYSPADLEFIVPRVLELTYTSWDMQPFARDLDYEGEPYRWNTERRAQLRAELDAYYAWLYGLTRDELCYVLDPKEVMGEDWPSESFRVLKEREEGPPPQGFGEYRTRRLVLEAFDRFHADGTFDPARTRDPHYLPQVQRAYGEMKARYEASEQQRSELELLYRHLLARTDETCKPVLFVEGATDVPVIEAAWEVFFPGEERPFEVLAAEGTLQMRALATPGKAMRKLLGDRLVLALADNDGAGRLLWDEGNLHKGGVWKQQTNGVHWCLLQPSEEFRAIMERLGVPASLWPFLLENAFSPGIRRQAMAEGAYSLSDQLFGDFGRAPDLVRKLPALFKELPDDDPTWLYLLAPTPEAKETFAAWISAPERRTPETYASFRVTIERLKQLLERHQEGEGRQARLL